MSNQFIKDLREISAFYDEFEGLEKALNLGNLKGRLAYEPLQDKISFSFRKLNDNQPRTGNVIANQKQDFYQDSQTM